MSAYEYFSEVDNDWRDLDDCSWDRIHTFDQVRRRTNHASKLASTDADQSAVVIAAFLEHHDRPLPPGFRDTDVVAEYFEGGLRRELKGAHLRAVLADRDVAIRQRGHAVDANRVLIDSASRADRRAEADEARVAELEAELAALTEPTEWGTAGVDWGVGFYSDERPIAKRVHSEVEARETIANWAGWYPNDPQPPVLLRREHAAWHRWPLDEDEADEIAAKEEGDA